MQHGRTFGEAEWALVVTEDDVLLTVACDHTDHALEVHGVASKQAGPDVLRARDLLRPGTVLLSGTIPMRAGVNQFATSWRVELRDPATGNTIECAYQVRPLPVAIG